MDRQLASVMARGRMVVTGEDQYARDLEYLRHKVCTQMKFDPPVGATAARLVAQA